MCEQVIILTKKYVDMLTANYISCISFVKIRFSVVKFITAVATQGWKDAKNLVPDCWVKRYFLEYSEDQNIWKIHKDGASRRVGILVFIHNHSHGSSFPTS